MNSNNFWVVLIREFLAAWYFLTFPNIAKATLGLCRPGLNGRAEPAKLLHCQWQSSQAGRLARRNAEDARNDRGPGLTLPAAPGPWRGPGRRRGRRGAWLYRPGSLGPEARLGALHRQATPSRPPPRRRTPSVPVWRRTDNLNLL